MKTVARMGTTEPAGKGGGIVSFVLVLLCGIIAQVFEGICKLPGGLAIHLMFILLVYVGIYKSPGVSMGLAVIFGLLLELFSGASIGQGLFSSFFIVGVSWVISGAIYADRIIIRFFTIGTATFSIYPALLFIHAVFDRPLGNVYQIIYGALLSSIMTASAGILLIQGIKYLDPDRGGYYLTRFMREERMIPLV